MKFLTAFENIFRTIKIYYISLLYYQNKLYKYSLSLNLHWQQGIGKIQEQIESSAGEIRAQIESFDKDHDMFDTKLQSLFEQLKKQFEEVVQQMGTLRKQTKIALYDE